MKRKIIIGILIVATIGFLKICVYANPSIDHVKEGDIIFQTSKSRQSKYIAFGTMSKWTHCGIMVKKNGKWKVLEASATVKLTPLNEFIKRGKGGNYEIKRLKNCPKLKYNKYLGKSYDTKFEWNNRKMYCSELVYKVFEDAGITLCDKRKVSSYLSAKLLRRYIKQRGISSNETVVAPSDIYNSSLLSAI